MRYMRKTESFGGTRYNASNIYGKKICFTNIFISVLKYKSIRFDKL